MRGDQVSVFLSLLPTLPWLCATGRCASEYLCDIDGRQCHEQHTSLQYALTRDNKIPTDYRNVLQCINTIGVVCAQQIMPAALYG